MIRLDSVAHIAHAKDSAAWSLPLAFVLLAFLAGCEPMAVTLAGVGTATGVNHALGGVVYKTFTEPMPKVNRGAHAALDRMAIKVESSSMHEGTRVITATAHDRKIEIELEPISPNTTRMRAVARKPWGFWDSATATEIILETDKSLSTS
jgi:hypothetical protein